MEKVAVHLFALIERVFRAVPWCSESPWRWVIPRPEQAGTAAACQHSQPVSKHTAVSFALFVDLKGSPRLCYPWGCMEVAAKDKQESFSFLLGLRNCALCVLFFLSFFFSLFLLMRCTKEGGKANLIIKPYLPPFSVFPDWEVQSSPLWCKNEFSSMHC